MTEDETIRVLRDKIPFYEMMKIYRSGKGPKYPNNSHDAWEEFFLAHGWRWKEFVADWKNWNGGTSTYADFERTK